MALNNNLLLKAAIGACGFGVVLLVINRTTEAAMAITLGAAVGVGALFWRRRRR